MENIVLTLLTLSVGGWCGRAVYTRYAEFLSAGKIVPTFAAISVILIFGVFLALWLIWKKQLPTFLQCLKSRLPLFCKGTAVLLCLLPGVIYNFTRFSEPWSALPIRIGFSLTMLLTGAWLMESENGMKFASLIRCALIFSAGFVLCTQFRDLSRYPFSIGWSEGNRIWDYSVLFGKSRYNYPQNQSIPAYIDIGRQSLWGLIFLFPHTNILTMRCWNDILFTIPCALLGWTLLRRSRCSFAKKAAAALWTMLFLMQGPIYTPLTIAAILVAIGRNSHFTLNCILTAIAGFYAVMSRSTWVAAPSAYAVFCAFLDERPAKERWTKALTLGSCGLIGAFLYLKRDFFLPKAAEAAEEISEAMPPMLTPAWFRYVMGRQPLLWDRLFPNETYAPGILLGLAIAILPMVCLLLLWGNKHGRKYDFWQRVLLYGGSAIFLAAGLIFSVKIGGGSNLHNLDMFLILELFIAAICVDAGFADWLGEQIRGGKLLICLLTLTAVLLPCWNDLRGTSPKIFPDPVTTQDAVEQIRAAVAEHADEEILFLDQRQLLTFGTVENVPLIAEYEKKWMMDEAMADNAAFFAPYHADLKAHRFALIISEPLHVNYQGAGGDFTEENDLFVKWVSEPTLEYYEPLETFPEQGVQLLVPKK